jgi:hypothetical protein
LEDVRLLGRWDGSWNAAHPIHIPDQINRDSPAAAFVDDM